MKPRFASWMIAIVLLMFMGTGCSLSDLQTLDLPTLAKKVQPAVLLLVVSDATGKEIGTGTGFLVSADGKVMTNWHVVEKAASIIAKAENGAFFPVTGILDTDDKNDLALLKISAKDLPYLILDTDPKIIEVPLCTLLGFSCAFACCASDPPMRFQATRPIRRQWCIRMGESLRSSSALMGAGL